MNFLNFKITLMNYSNLENTINLNIKNNFILTTLIIKNWFFPENNTYDSNLNDNLLNIYLDNNNGIIIITNWNNDNFKFQVKDKKGVYIKENNNIKIPFVNFIEIKFFYKKIIVNKLGFNLISINEFENLDSYNPTYLSIKTDNSIKEYSQSSSKFSDFNKDLRCCICFEINLQNKCFLSECKHEFCLDCIMNWFSVHSVCPLCKNINKFIIKYFNNEIQKFEINKVTPNEDDFESLELEVNETCYSCNSSINQNELLICNFCNFRVCHSFCLNPSSDINNLNVEDWYCDYCVKENNLNFTIPIVGIFIPRILKNHGIFRNNNLTLKKAIFFKDLLKKVIIYPHVIDYLSSKQKNYLYNLASFIE